MQKVANIIAAILALSLATRAGADCPLFDSGLQIGTVENDYLNEISGIAASRANTDVIWAHNDRGDSARIWALNIHGTHLGTYALSGAVNTDWEDIAVGPGPLENIDYIYVADIGDNYATRSSVTIYRLPEPAADANQYPVYEFLTGIDAIALEYPDGPHDAEAMMVDPLTKDIYIFSKENGAFRLYRAPYPQSTTSIKTMEYKGWFGWANDVSAADVSPNADMIVIRNDGGYGSLYLRPTAANLWEAFSSTQCYIPIEWEANGEAISFDAKACGYYTTSEGPYQPIFYYARQGICPPIPCDFDPDGAVDFKDLAVLFDSYLLSDPALDLAPPGGDGVINLLDIAFCSLYRM
ncbi:MAG: hypothetical protein JW720_05500 [Sedimentisphaerales bacterium]|nr:hypothetical protein [Sedimentisphaerales bacterium]